MKYFSSVFRTSRRTIKHNYSVSLPNQQVFYQACVFTLLFQQDSHTLSLLPNAFALHFVLILSIICSLLCSPFFMYFCFRSKINSIKIIEIPSELCPKSHYIIIFPPSLELVTLLKLSCILL